MSTNSRALAPFEIDAILRRIARRQLGLVTVRDAVAGGVELGALARRRASGAVVPVVADVMRLAASPPSPHQRILAGALAVPRSVVAATSAAVALGLPLAPAVGSEVPVVAVGKSRSARTPGVHVLRSSCPMPSRPWHTARIASPAAALVQLARFVDEGELERCLDHCLAHRLVSVRSVVALLERLPARAVPGRRALLDLLGDRSGGIGHRSQLERVVAGWLDGAGLTGWERNVRVPVGGDRSVEVDFGWVAAKVALEVSPFFTHGSQAQQERDALKRQDLVRQEWRVVDAVDRHLQGIDAFAPVVATLAALLGGGTSCALAAAERRPAHTTSRRAG